MSWNPHPNRDLPDGMRCENSLGAPRAAALLARVGLGGRRGRRDQLVVPRRERGIVLLCRVEGRSDSRNLPGSTCPRELGGVLEDPGRFRHAAADLVDLRLVDLNQHRLSPSWEWTTSTRT